MAMLSFSRNCSNCVQSVSSWRIVPLTPWSCSRCPHCGGRLNHSVSILHSLTGFLIAMPLLVLACLRHTPFGEIHYSIPIRLLCFLGACLVFSAYEALTVRLVKSCA